jgi:enamine deaminase RidA (YjgF/YER057c/UK114 family)
MANQFNIEANLEAMGIVLPAAPLAVGKYLPVVMHNGIGYVSGQFPFKEEKLLLQGEISDITDIRLLQEAVKIATLNVLAQIKQALGSWERLVCLARVDGFFLCREGYANHAGLLNTASELLVQVLGDKGVHARTVFGAKTLPFQAPVELVVQFFYRD